MTRSFSCHLLTMLAEVPDPRKKKGQRHPLAAMLTLTVVRLLCGQRGYTAIAKWARLHPDLREALGFTAKQTPAALTFHYLYRRKPDITAENKLHWVRDAVFREDASNVRTGVIPQVMAAMRNTAISVLRFTGWTKITDALQYLAAEPKLAVNIIK